MREIYSIDACIRKEDWSEINNLPHRCVEKEQFTKVNRRKSKIKIEINEIESGINRENQQKQK